jgi:hypothetical protein
MQTNVNPKNEHGQHYNDFEEHRYPSFVKNKTFVSQVRFLGLMIWYDKNRTNVLNLFA